MSIPQLTPPTAAIDIPVLPVIEPAPTASFTHTVMKESDQPVSDLIDQLLEEAWMESEIQSLLVARDPDDDDDDIGEDDDFDDDDEEGDDDTDDEEDDFDGDDDFDEEEDDFADEDDDDFDEEE